MKQSFVKICSVVYVIGLFFSFSFLSVPPGLLPIYLGLLLFAMMPLIYGSRRYRIFGCVAVAITILFSFLEYRAGVRFHRYREELREKFEEQDRSTNVTSRLETK